jgi:pimeloyl-ACP methyl ester carboxylesterase
MSTFVLIPGAGGAGTWPWHLVVRELEAAGHDAVAVDLPADDPSAGLPEYVELVREAAGEREVVLVAQSMGAFTAFPACERVGVERLVLLNAMIPARGETAGDWWENVSSEAARVEAARAGGYTETIDLETYFLHDVPPAVAAWGDGEHRPEADIAFEQPCEFGALPPTTVLAGRDDRFFPVAFQRRVARERLGVEAREVPGGHLNALSEPRAVAEALLGERPR